MDTPSIRIENLGKSYRIGRRREHYRTLRETLTGAAAAPWRRAARILRGDARGASDLEETMWALRNVSFNVAPGEVLGVIGRNGAGKSTLLKVLSRITEPAEGFAEVLGRVGSLLEVGTGFHPELTGRENVFLNGAILGMPRREIARKFEAIVSFAEVERFIDTPVKHYSSGMYVRLAFAVAAHLDPDILLVDEVLAVGDAAFQKKCIAAISAGMGEGRTALVVSHNMGVVRALCTRAVLLEGGRLAGDGTPEDVIAAYHRTVLPNEGIYRAGPDREKKGGLWFSAVTLRNGQGDPVTEIPCGEELRIDLDLAADPGTRIERPWVGVSIVSTYGQMISHLGNREAGFELPGVGNGDRVTCRLEPLNLTPGAYALSFGISDVQGHAFDRVEGGLLLTVTPADYFGSGWMPSGRLGTALFRSRWTVGQTGPGTDGEAP